MDRGLSEAQAMPERASRDVGSWETGRRGLHEINERRYDDMELYLIRHGQSANNATEASGERVCDPPLTEMGRRQSELTARRVGDLDWARLNEHDGHRGVGLTRLYSSPMLRALETADAIRKTTGRIPHVWIDVHEHGGIWLDHGDGKGPVGLPGMTREQMRERFPDFVIPQGVQGDGWWSRPMESDESAFVRARIVASQLQGLAETEERIGIVSHGGFADSMIGALLNLPFAPALRFSHNNGAISRVDVTPGRVELRFLNRLDHLSAELVT